MLEVRNLSVDFNVANNMHHAVKDISFSISQGETVALVGESGSGKSVSALSILRLLPYPMASHPSGKILWQGQDLLKLSENHMRPIRGDAIAMIFQEPMTALNPLHSIGRQISEVLFTHKNMSAKQARARVLELLDLVELEGLQGRLDAFPHQLSGGQRQRVMIAMALANEPKLLIADEPTTALDVTVQAEILQLLKNLQKKMNMGILLISHDLGVVRYMADKIAVMQQGEIVEFRESAALFESPQHEYTKALLASKPSGKPYAMPDNAPEIMRVENINVVFGGKKKLFQRKAANSVHAVKDISFSINQGETLGIVGESGSGKTTLGLALLRLQKSTGRIVYQGRDIADLNSSAMRPIRKHMQIVFQDPYGSLSPRMSIGEIIAEGLRVHEPQLTQAEREARVIDALQTVQLDPETRHRYPHEFSGGQRQRISLARAFVLKPQILVLDEPTSALDVSVQAQIVDLLRKLQKDFGLSYVFISHDLRVVRAISHRVIVMKSGQIVEQNDTESLFDAPQESYTKQLISAIVS